MVAAVVVVVFVLLMVMTTMMMIKSSRFSYTQFKSVSWTKDSRNIYLCLLEHKAHKIETYLFTRTYFPFPSTCHFRDKWMHVYSLRAQLPFTLLELKFPFYT
jgi:hypothetical protein